MQMFLADKETVIYLYDNVTDLGERPILISVKLILFFLDSNNRIQSIVDFQTTFNFLKQLQFMLLLHNLRDIFSQQQFFSKL